MFYRSVKSDPPTERDFLSSADLGKRPPRSDPAFLHVWAGLSVFDTYEQARSNAHYWRWRHGEYIAELIVPSAAPIIFEGPNEVGHWNLYDAPASQLLNWVSRVVHGPSTLSVAPP